MAHFRTDEDMFPLVAQWQESDQTQKAFCTQHSIPVSVFAYWLRRYRDQQGGSSDQVTGFVPVRLTDSGSSSLEVVLPSGTVLRFAQVVPLSYLKALL